MSLYELPSPDFYMASMGRSGSTALCNWLTTMPDYVVLIEPLLFSLRNPDLLRIQFENMDMAIGDEEWEFADSHYCSRFERLFAPRLLGRHWALKEVLSREHERVLEVFRPPRVLVTVRDIMGIAASLFEKHRMQGNEAVYNAEWIANYCITEADAMVTFVERLEATGLPLHIVRYEEIISSVAAQRAVSTFLGWPSGGRTDRHFDRLNRGFEADRHGNALNSKERSINERNLPSGDLDLITRIAEACSTYQSTFGYTN